MNITRARTLTLLAVVGLVLGVSALRLLQAVGGPGLPMPWAVTAVPLAASALILWFAWPVHRWASGRRDRPLDPHRAARTVVLAKSATVAAALLAGWYAGQAAWLWWASSIEVYRDRAAVATAAAVGFLVLLAAGLVAQYWCRLPPEDDEHGAGRPSQDRSGRRSQPDR